MDERVGGIGPPFRPWQGRVKAIIRYPQISYKVKS